MERITERPSHHKLEQLIGRVVEVPSGTMRLDAIREGETPDRVHVRITGLDLKGKEVYSEEKEDSRISILQLFGWFNHRD